MTLFDVTAAGVITVAKRWDTGDFVTRLTGDDIFDIISIPRGNTNFVYLSGLFSVTVVHMIDLVMTPVTTTEKKWDSADEMVTPTYFWPVLAVDVTPGMVLFSTGDDEIY